MRPVKFTLFILTFLCSLISAQPPTLKMAAYLYQFPDGEIDGARLKKVSAIATDLSGFLYLADTGNNRILKMTPEGTALKTIGGFGWEKEQFYTPLDICTGSALDVFVADYDNQRIQRYDKDLNYISSLYSDENLEPTFRFGYPRSIGLSIHGDLFILDGENNRVLKFNSSGEPEISFGDYRDGRGRLLEPVQLAIAPKDKIYVSDRRAGKISVFDYFGNFLFDFGSTLLREPLGICFSGKDKLLVADGSAKQIIVFDSLGELIFKWSMITPQLGEFKNPVDVAVHQQRAFVIDNDRILVIELK
ncbi:MAG: NHL repeat-containing protein [bacterium]|nr:NHL repeat-containing protein [bacterium]